MASKIQILTNKGTLDLAQGADRDFYVTRQIHDLNNFESRNADFTKTIKVPATPNNIDILDAYTGSAGAVNQTIPCQILMDGITIAPSAKLLFFRSIVNNAEIGYEVNILYGNFNLFDDITAGDISDINWQDLAFSLLPTTYVLLSQNTTDLVTPIADWVTRASNAVMSEPSVSPTLDIEINATGFFLYTKEIIRRIASEAGYTVVYGANMPADYDLLALACPVSQMYEIEALSQISFSSTANKSGPDQVVDGATVRATFQSVAGDPLNQWSNITHEWTIQNPDTLTIRVEGIYSIDNGSAGLPPSEFVIYQNLNPIATFLMSQADLNDEPFSFSTKVGVLAGDVIYCEIVAQAGGNNDTATLHTNSHFTISTPGADVSNDVRPGEWVPQISKSDFMASILKLFNLVMQTDDISSVITIEPFDNIYSGKEQDLSVFLDAGLNDIVRENAISSIAQAGLNGLRIIYCVEMLMRVLLLIIRCCRKKRM